jgi:hypothetical protein
VTVRGSSGGGRVTVVIATRRRAVARGTRTVSAGRWSVRAKLTRGGRARLRHARRLRATVSVRLTPSSGAPVTKTARVILRR